jgi:RNA polymerase sigma factor (sigma-70 family)
MVEESGTPRTALELIDEIRAGRDVRAAQEKLYALVRQGLLARLDRRIPAHLRSRLDAEDVLHDAFLRSLGALDRFIPKDERSFLTWVYCIAKNAIINAAGRHSAIVQHFARDGDLGGPRESRVMALGTSPTESLRVRDFCGRVLEELDARERDVLHLRHFEGRSYEEIAEAWGMTPAAVRQCHSRALRNARAIAERASEVPSGDQKRSGARPPRQTVVDNYPTEAIRISELLGTCPEPRVPKERAAPRPPHVEGRKCEETLEREGKQPPGHSHES